MQKAVVVVGLAVLANMLWGSAAPVIKTGYRLFEVAADDTASQILFAGIRFFLAGILAIGSILCDVAVQMVTGWNRLIPMLFYGIVLSVSIGAGVAFLICFFGPFFKRK